MFKFVTMSLTQPILFYHTINHKFLFVSFFKTFSITISFFTFQLIFSNIIVKSGLECLRNRLFRDINWIHALQEAALESSYIWLRGLHIFSSIKSRHQKFYPNKQLLFYLNWPVKNGWMVVVRLAAIHLQKWKRSESEHIEISQQ